LFWARGEMETAKRMMKLLIDDMETVRLTSCLLCAKCLKTGLNGIFSSWHFKANY